MAKAKWAVAVTRRSVDADGTLHVEATVSDDGTPQADVVLTVSADRALRLLVTNRTGSQGLTGFDAWMTEATA